MYEGICPVCGAWVWVYGRRGFQQPATTANTRIGGHLTHERAQARRRPEGLPPLPEGGFA